MWYICEVLVCLCADVGSLALTGKWLIYIYSLVCLIQRSIFFFTSKSKGLQIFIKYLISNYQFYLWNAWMCFIRTIYTYHKKNGIQQSMKMPMMMPSVRAALCSRFILIKCLSLVGVCSWSTSFNVSVFDEPEPLSASPVFVCVCIRAS